VLAAPALVDRTYDFEEIAFDPLIEIARASVPVVVLDLPHQWSGWVRRQLWEADEVVLVAGPDLADLRNAKNIVDVLRAARPNDAPPRLVFNATGMPKRPEIKLHEFAKALDLPITANIPFDAALFGNAANKGQMIGEIDGKHAIAEIFRDLATIVTGRGEVRRPKRSTFAPLLERLRLRRAS
jgi:pilus assembly protein CpaE